jgi:predicted methyltransferase
MKFRAMNQLLAARVIPLALLLLPGCQSLLPAAGTVSSERIAEILASPDRSAEDRKNDERRKPALLLAFIGVRPGMVAMDLNAGGGYTSELLARAVGPAGKVYGQGTRAITAQRLAERARNPAAGNIASVTSSLEDPVPPALSGSLDLVTFMFNYHDLGHLGVNRALLNRAVFNALKPGGLYVVADHSGRPGTGMSESGTLHRVEQALVRAEVEAAGFRFAEEGNFLRNPDDPRDRKTPEPDMPKDEFVLKFVKPA